MNKVWCCQRQPSWT